MRWARVAVVLLTLLGAVFAVVVLRPASSRLTAGTSSTAFAAPGTLPDGKGRRSPVLTTTWPRVGQGAYAVDDGASVQSPDELPVPIASVAKVMTAYLLLKHHPLQEGEDGPRFTVTQDDVTDTDARRHGGQSVVAVSAGEQLTELDALMAILLPSANNVALLVARQVSGSVEAFVAEMNQAAAAIGMPDTTYTDPSGLDPGTVSTARDQLRLARLVAANPTLAAVMATRSYELPVAGTIANTDTLLGSDGFIGMKTGSHAAAGGCFMFRAVTHTASGKRSVIGVVLGQRGGNLIDAGLLAAQQLVVQLTQSARTPLLRHDRSRITGDAPGAPLPPTIAAGAPHG